ncbi:MAG: ribosome maturation factor RimM [Desulfobacterales bacterium]|nr:ribosome maturation factor RimM [Desulfobacterales bacterium]
MAGKNNLISVGKIIGAHGIKGDLKIYSYAEDLSVFEQDGTILIRTTDGREKRYPVLWAKPHSRTVLLSLESVNGRDQAEALKGAELFIEKESLPSLEDGTYYWADLIGLDVFTADENHLGILVSIMPTGSNDVYVVKGKAGETLVPALESVVLEIDLDKKMMRVELPEGL